MKTRAEVSGQLDLLTPPGTMTLTELVPEYGIVMLEIRVTPGQTYATGPNPEAELYLAQLPVEALPAGAEVGDQFVIRSRKK